MKKINWKKVSLYFLGIVILLRGLSEVYMSGFFHPKEFTLNGIKITAPEDTYLMNAMTDDARLFDVLSPLRLNFTSKYNMLDGERIFIIFYHPGTFGNAKMKDVWAQKTDLSAFQKRISREKEDENVTVTAIEKEYDNCSEVYEIYSSTPESKDILLFNHQKKIEFLIYVDPKTDLNAAVAEICDNQGLK